MAGESSTSPSHALAVVSAFLHLSTPTDAERAKSLFTRHASAVVNGESFLSRADFTSAIRPKHELFALGDAHADLLFSVADRSRRGLISLADFTNFHALLAGPHAEIEILARLVGDNKGVAALTVDDLKAFLSTRRSPAAAPFDFGSEALRPLLAVAAKRPLSLNELGEIVRVLQAERLRLEYKRLDPKNSGTISGADLRALVGVTARHRLSARLLENLPIAFPQASFADVLALHSVLSKLDVVDGVVSKLAAANAGAGITKPAFASAASRALTYDLISPLEIDVIFRALGAAAGAALEPAAFDALLNPSYNPVAPASEPVRLSAGMEVAKSVYNFALGSVAGAIGATFVYPIDLVKTRMQNQRSKVVGQLLYKNSWDCFKKVLRNEGFPGLYSGLLPQLVGVAPEKAIKLTMNDLVRSKVKDPKTGEIPLWGEILAGCTAGGSQVLFTNPLEIVKIRLQVQGEVAKAGIEGAAPRQSAVGIVRQLGLFGLYRGVGACLLRDIPFSGIYFPVYAHLKKDLFHEGKNGKKLSVVELLTAGALAGMPAAYLVTPADVIKTRLQVAARKGESTYSGIIDAAVKIRREEGFRAFFKGGLARVFRSSPQFGVTLAAYEFLHKTLPVDFGDEPQDHNHAQQSSSLTPSEAGLRSTIRVIGDLSIAK
ncbi:mitochondrial aspartate-glutamate transporter agc1 [Polyrhizophydium stewartii]|uniref:Mitochondrial aspartate-glutamate transporter agc1 n=1 Tax=Polyrhizophydium stewartii TaxID=2732419 RepID=A0ABR4NGZ0_9FUNG|nr:mitochondrial aspartate-glutamate transporter agc1 [Polyrhizophydium stewartii]